MGGKWSVSVLLLCPYAPPFGGGNIRWGLSVFLGCGCVGGFNLNRQPFPRLQYSPAVALSPLWRCGCSPAVCRLSCRLLLCRSLNRPTKSPQRALTLPLRHFSALGGLSLRLGRFRAVSALYRLRAVATLCASRVSASLRCMGRLEGVALLAGVILEGVGLGGEFAVK